MIGSAKPITPRISSSTPSAIFPALQMCCVIAPPRRRIVAAASTDRQLSRHLGTSRPACDHCASVIPIRDTIVSSTTPIVTYALIAANVAVYVHQDSLGPGFERFIQTYGLVPR